MIIVCGYPAPRPRRDQPAGPGKLHVMIDEEVRSFYVEEGTLIDKITMGGEPLPVGAELWYESDEERSH